MSESYPFPTYSGILDPTHYKKIGPAIWLFLWCISSTTKEYEEGGITWGVVLGNKPIKISELELVFGVSEKTVRSWIKSLERHGYIKVLRAPYGLIFTVRNSKKFIDRSEANYRSRAVENDQSHGGEWKETADLPEENYRSNKDIIEINNAAVVNIDSSAIMKKATEIEAYFCQKRGRGFSVSPADFAEIKKMVADGIPLEVIKKCIDRSFAEYVPRHRKDEIRSITYCIPRCYDEWYKMQANTDSITGAVPHVPVALGSVQTRKGKQQQQVDDLKKLIEEEKKREALRSS